MDHAQAVNTLASERYLLGEMSGPERDAFEDHFFSCTDCAEDVRAAALMREGAKAGLLPVGHTRTAGVPTQGTVTAFRPRVSRARWASTALPWAMAAMLGGVAAYQSLLVVPGLQRQVAPQALAPVVLRPATRGADPVVALSAGHPVTLAIDVNVPAPVNDLSYALQTAGGAVILTGHAPMPPAGTPLLLLVPSTAFSENGRYILSLSHADGTKESLGDYRFVIERR